MKYPAFLGTLIASLFLPTLCIGKDNLEIEPEQDNYCNYTLGDKLKKASSPPWKETQSKVTVHALDLNIIINNKIKSGRLKFTCFENLKQTSETPEEVTSPSAAVEIANEDSGGRYYRIVSWEKPIIGQNWKGTIAYTNSSFGDNQKILTPDFFYICPNNRVTTCFSFSFSETGTLKNSEAATIPQILSDIKINNQ